MDRFKKAEKLIAQAKHREALEMLKAFPHGDFSSKELAFYHILLSESAIITGEESLVEGLDEAIECFRYDPDTAKFARAKYAKGLWLSVQGDYSQAQESLLEAHSNYLRCQELLGAAKSLNRLAYIALQLGDITAVTDNLDKARHVYRRLKHRPREIAIAVNLCLLYLLTGSLTETIKNCAEIEPYVETCGEQTKILFPLVSAMAHALRGDTVTAMATIRKAKPFVDKYQRDKSFYYQYLAWAYLLGEQYDAAERILLEELRHAEGAFTDLRSSDLKRTLADTYMASKRFAEAAPIAREAFNVAKRTNDRTEIAACYSIFGQLAHHDGDLEAARKWFDQAIDLYYLIRCRYNLAVTRYLAARTNLYSPEEKLELLHQAREYFQSEEIDQYLEKVDRELGKLNRATPSADLPRPRIHTDRSGHMVERPDIVTVSSEMKKALDLGEKVAGSDMNVLITGETGTGKDLMARYIHHHSRRPGRFVSINAAAIPESMVESELFGHAKGAFTGADHNKPGLFEMADEGTFFLDEIADTSPSFQAKLLEVIESRSIRRLGETKQRPVNFRLISATNQDLESRITDRLFRTDLFHRLNEFLIHLPPLSERLADFRPLTEYFLRTSGFDPNENGHPALMAKLAESLSKRHWPGNVRQLRAEISYLVVVSDRDIHRMAAIAEESDRHSGEYRRLRDALDSAHGNQSLAARRLGIPESTLRYRLKKHRHRQSR